MDRISPPRQPQLGVILTKRFIYLHNFIFLLLAAFAILVHVSRFWSVKTVVNTFQHHPPSQAGNGDKVGPEEGQVVQQLFRDLCNAVRDWADFE